MRALLLHLFLLFQSSTLSACIFTKLIRPTQLEKAFIKVAFDSPFHQHLRKHPFFVCIHQKRAFTPETFRNYFTSRLQTFSQLDYKLNTSLAEKYFSLNLKQIDFLGVSLDAKSNCSYQKYLDQISDPKVLLIHLYGILFAESNESTLLKSHLNLSFPENPDLFPQDNTFWPNLSEQALDLSVISKSRMRSKRPQNILHFQSSVLRGILLQIIQSDPAAFDLKNFNSNSPLYLSLVHELDTLFQLQIEFLDSIR